GGWGKGEGGGAARNRQQGDDCEKENCGQQRVAAAPAPAPLEGSHWPGRDRSSREETREVVGQCGRAGVSPGRLLLQTFQTDCLQIVRQLWPHLARRNGLACADLFEDIERRFSLKRRSSGEALVEDASHPPHTF